MAVSHWIIAGAVFIILVVLALGIGWWIRNHSPTTIPPQYSTVLMWSHASPGPDPLKNTCQIYQFPTSKTANGTVFAGTPTFNSTILNGLTGLTGYYPYCLDEDQTWAMQFQQVCSPTGTGGDIISDPRISLCTLMTGGKTGLGGTEVFYANTAGTIQCTPTKTCPGQLSVVSVNYQVPQISPNCITQDPSGILMTPCDPSVPSQVFRVTRTDIGVNPDYLVAGSGQNGLLAQILDRNTGLCLTAGQNKIDTYYYPTYLKSIGCGDSAAIGVSGYNVEMNTCTGGGYTGYVWALFPSMKYCPSTSQTCTFTPPQISYVGDVDMTQLPSGTATYGGLTGSSATVQWLLDNNVSSLYWGGTGASNISATVILRSFATDHTLCINKPYISQYINIPLYNIITTESVCYADNYNPSCYSFS